MTFEAIECENASDAIQCADASGGEPIRVGGKMLVVAQREADRLDAAGIEFAYLCEHVMPDGTSRIMTVPVN